MAVDFNRLKHFSMTYVFLDDDGDIACEYEQTEQNPVVAPDSHSIRFGLRHIDPNEDPENYTVELVKKGDDFYIKSDYFDDADKPYPLDIDSTDDDVKFILEGEDEIMYLYGFF